MSTDPVNDEADMATVNEKYSELSGSAKNFILREHGGAALSDLLAGVHAQVRPNLSTGIDGASINELVYMLLQVQTPLCIELRKRVEASVVFQQELARSLADFQDDEWCR
jgi:hypothetical protein